MKNAMIHGFKKCPSVSRPRGYFYYSEAARLWIVQNWLTGDWFFEKESDTFPVKAVRSRIYFKTSRQALAYFKAGDAIPF